MIALPINGTSLLVQARGNIRKIRNSICNGAGRKLTEEDAGKEFWDGNIGFESIRKEVYIPDYIYDESIIGNHPSCYRTAEETISPIKEWIKIIAKLRPIATTMPH